ncbi:MAG: hypothetical protein P1V97_38920 [Planctomycetota bacterium]|nr:hypothetical protein [Planctomycetota bacterium]
MSEDRGYETLPVVFVHGVHGETTDWQPLLARLHRGRALYKSVYAGDSDLFETDSIPKASFFNFGLYHENKDTPKYYKEQRPNWPSIGGCPVPRTDSHNDRYKISIAHNLERTIENVCRATGSEQVDLVGFSMGGIVIRAYTRWCSFNGPEGRSRVRRLLIVGSPSLGINALEASALGYASAVARRDKQAMQGEAAELNVACEYWGGDSYINHLNNDWDAFCEESGIVYGNIYCFGASVYGRPFFVGTLQSQSFWLRPMTKKTLLHAPSNFNYEKDLEETTGDSDYVVRVASASLPKEDYPHCKFNQAFEGVHDGWLNALFPTEYRLHRSFFTEAVIRRFVLEGQDSADCKVISANLELVEIEKTKQTLILETEIEGTGQLSARVTLVPLRFAKDPKGLLAKGFRGLKCFGVLLQPGKQRVFLDIQSLSGTYQLSGEVYCLGEDTIALETREVSLRGKGQAWPELASSEISVERNDLGHLQLKTELSQNVEVSWSLNGGEHGRYDWSEWQRGGTIFLPDLANDTSWDLLVRSRQTLLSVTELEAPRPAGVRLVIGKDGAIRFHSE